jgi:hypothetical protein
MTMRAWTGAAVAVVVGLVAGCSADAESSAGPTSAPASTAPAPPTSLAGPGCPVDDAEFCQRAAGAANALLAGDPAGVLAVSAEETFTCDDMPAGIVPACRPGAVMTGHGVFAVASKISVVPARDYREWLAGLFGRVSPGYADGRGPGRFVVLGVGTCGPADPDRRSYHLAFTVALTGPKDEPARRWLGSLEFVRRAGAWVTALMYLDTVDEWRREHADPYTGIACGNVRPWRA